MKTAETINLVCEKTGIAKSELARRMGMHSSSLYRKLSRETMTFEEFQRCLDVLNVSIEFTMHYPDGSKGSSSERQELMLEKMAIVESELEIAKKALEFYRKTIKDIRTELHSTLAYAELGIAHEEKREDCLNNIKSALGNMESLVSCVTGDNLSSAGDDEEIDISSIRGKRVLIVDDNQINREVLREMLNDSGLETEEAVDGSEAVAKIKGCEPGYYDFILIDLEMPVMDGFETVSVIRNLPNRIRASIPVIALTANDIHENRERAFAVGMDDYIMKPADSNSLLRGLARLR